MYVIHISDTMELMKLAGSTRHFFFKLPWTVSMVSALISKTSVPNRDARSDWSILRSSYHFPPQMQQLYTLLIYMFSSKVYISFLDFMSNKNLKRVAIKVMSQAQDISNNAEAKLSPGPCCKQFMSLSHFYLLHYTKVLVL